VAEGEFRQDLFYRLNVFPIRLPALRERISDTSLLVGYLIGRYAKKLGKNIDKKTVELFHAYDWPGNIRELQNVVKRAVILVSSTKRVSPSDRIRGAVVAAGLGVECVSASSPP